MHRDRHAHVEAADHWARACRQLTPLLAEARAWREAALVEWLAALHAGRETGPAAARLEAAGVAYSEWFALLLRADLRLAAARRVAGIEEAA